MSSGAVARVPFGVQGRNATKRARTGSVYPERGENAPKRPEKAGVRPWTGLDGRGGGEERHEHQKMPIPDCR